MDHTGMSDICVTNDYEVIAVATNGSNFYATEIASTLSESTSDTLCTPAGTKTVEVSGQMVQPGWVSMGDQGQGASPGPWSYRLNVTPGLHDLIAISDRQVGTSGSILIRRRQSISAATTEPLIDVSSGGMQLETTPLSIAGTVSGDSFQTFLWLTTGSGDIATISDRVDAVVDAIPGALIETSDRQWLEVDATRHGASVQFTGSETSFVLLPPLTGITIDPTPMPTASWSTIPVDGYTEARLSISADTPACLGCAIQWVFASRGWLDTYGATSLAFDTTAPGYQSSWIIDSSMTFAVGFSISIDTPTTSIWTATAPLQHDAVPLNSVPPTVRRPSWWRAR
jgi:hypothetical protein